MEAEFKDLKGKILTDIQVHNDEEIIFTCKTGEKYKMFHAQDCCETVTIEDINGDLNGLLNTEILIADEKISDCIEVDTGSQTHTFYIIRTIKESVDIRWFGESNGYYSETVNFEKIN